MARPKGSKNKVKTDVSSFFEEPVAPDDAKARRLARKGDSTSAPSPTTDPSVEEVRKRRIEREKSKPVETKSQEEPKKVAKKPGKTWKGEDTVKGQESSQNQASASARVASEEDKKALGYWERTWCSCVNDDKVEFYADDRKAFSIPLKRTGKI
jgi:hypothetical protein